MNSDLKNAKMVSLKFIAPIVLLVLVAQVQAHKKFYGGGGGGGYQQPGCKCDCYEPGYQGSGGYAQSHGPPIPTGGHYGNAGYHQPRPSGGGYASAQAVAGSYGGGGGQVAGGY